MNASAIRAHTAHQRRVAGESWDTIAEELEYASARSAKSSVRRYASQYGWTWPLDPPQPRVQSHDGIPVAGYASHPEAAYRLRVQGLKWQEVGTEMGLHSPNAHAIVMRYARKFAKRNGLPWPPKLSKSLLPLPVAGEEAYTLRATGLSWVDVGTASGLGMKARGRAQRYAEIAGKPWPVGLQTMSQRAYHLRHDNPEMTWRSIARQLGYSHSHHACAGARRHAHTLATVWMGDGRGFDNATNLAVEAVRAVGVLDTVPGSLLMLAERLLGSV